MLWKQLITTRFSRISAKVKHQAASGKPNNEPYLRQNIAFTGDVQFLPAIFEETMTSSFFFQTDE